MPVFLTLLAFCLSSVPAHAATYEVGPGQTYQDLEALRIAGLLAPGDIISINALNAKKDNSLTAPLYTGNGIITFSSTSDISTVFSPTVSSKANLFNNTTTNLLTLIADQNVIIDINSFTSIGNGAAINSVGGLTLRDSTPGTGSLYFTANKAVSGGAVYVRNGDIGTFTIANGQMYFQSNTATNDGGAVYARNAVELSGGVSTFSNNTAASNGGAIYLSKGNGALNITGGNHTFKNNTAGGSGGALYNNGKVGAEINLNPPGSFLIFENNTAVDNGGAIAAGIVIIQDGNNTFTNNATSHTNGGSGGAIYAETDVVISGGANKFSGNYSGMQGGAIYAADSLIISGGNNTFAGNTALENGGALNANTYVEISGGENIFTGNIAQGIPGLSFVNGQGGAVYLEESALFHASSGNITFAGNRDNVSSGGGKANSVYMHNHLTPSVAQNILTLAATGSNKLLFYDPINSRDKNSAGDPLSLEIFINPDITNNGNVRFDGTVWTGQGSANVADYKTMLYGNVTQSFGALDVTNGASLFISGNYTQASSSTLNLGIINGAPTINTGGIASLGGKVNIIGLVSNTSTVVLTAAQGISNLNVNDITVNGKPVNNVDFVDSLSANISPDNTTLSVLLGLTWNLTSNAHGTFTIDAGDFSIGVDLTNNTAGAAAGWDGKTLTKNAAGNLLLAGNNTYTGNTTINAGNLTVTGLLGAASNGNSGAYRGDISIAAGSTLTFYQSKNQILYGALSGAGALNAGGGGTLTLAGNNIYTGNTKLTDGNLEITGLLGAGAYAGDISLGLNSTLFLRQNADQTLSGNISGAGGLKKRGTGILTLSGNNTYSRSLNIEEGTVRIAAINSFSDGKKNEWVTMQPKATLEFNISDPDPNAVLSSQSTFYGSGTIIQNGSTPVLLSNLATYKGNFTVGANSSLKAAGKIAGGTFEGIINIGAGGFFNFENNNPHDNFTQVIASNAVIQGKGTLQQDRANNSTLLIKNLNSLQTSLFVKNGSVLIGNGTIHENLGLITIDSGGLLQLNRTDPTSIAFAGNKLAGTGTLQVKSGKLAINNSATSFSGDIAIEKGGTVEFTTPSQNLASLISGNGTFVKSGTGTLTLSAASTFSGETKLTGGTLAFAGIGSLSTSKLTLAGGTTLDISSASAAAPTTLEGLDVTGNATLATGNNTLNLADKNLAFAAGALSTGKPALNTTGTGKIDITGVNLSLYGQASQFSTLNKGDALTLMSQTTGTGSSATLVKTLLVDFHFGLSGSTGAFVALYTGSRGSEGSKVFGEGWLGGVAALTTGADMIAGEGMRGAQRAASETNGYAAGFGAVSGYNLRYNTGSHIDANGASLLAGLAWNQANGLTYGAFVEAGTGSYGTYNAFSSGLFAKGKGNTQYFGAGILARMEMNTGVGLAYVEGSARAGSLRNHFFTADLQAGYTSNMPYFGLHVGGGYLFSLSEKAKLDIYAKYFWTHQSGRHITLTTGDAIHYKAVNSNRLHLGTRIDFAAGEQFSPYAGVAWEYEFSGKAHASAYRTGLLVPSLKGSTVIGELGLSLKPSKLQGFSIDMGVQGFAGKRKGVSGNLMLKYAF